MAVIVINGKAKAASLPGMAGLRATAARTVRRAMDYTAAAVMICAVGAALLQLAAQIAGFPTPVAVTMFTVMAVVVLRSLRKHWRTRARHRRAISLLP